MSKSPDIKMKTDEIDTQIIELLQKNGRMPNTEISKKLSISETTVRKRLKKLIDEQYIQIVAVGNLLKLGYEIVGNIKVKIDQKKTDPIIEELSELEGVWYIAHMTGAADFDIEFQLKSQDDLRILLGKINKIDGIMSTETSFLLQQIKNRYDWGTPNKHTKG